MPSLDRDPSMAYGWFSKAHQLRSFEKEQSMIVHKRRYLATVFSLLAFHPLASPLLTAQTSTIGPRQDPRPQSGQITWSVYADGQHYSSVLTMKRLSKSPAWKDEEEHPPLSARKAMATARQMAMEIAPFGKQVKLLPPSLKLRESNGHWFWVVTFSPNDSRQFQSVFHVVVLMDGTALRPEKSEPPPLPFGTKTSETMKNRDKK